MKRGSIYGIFIASLPLCGLGGIFADLSGAASYQVVYVRTALAALRFWPYCC